MGAELSFVEIAVRLVLAAALAGALGLEREADGHEAGFRTHVLLGLGAALFGVVSVGAFDDFVRERAQSNIQVDVTRVASYVAAGVGFIGAGTILKGPGGIRGLTTATSLWTTAAIGLAAGVGFWQAAVTGAVIALISLALLRPVRTIAPRLYRVRRARAVFVLEPGAEASELVAALSSLPGLRLHHIRIEEADAPNRVRVIAEAQGDAETVMGLLGPLEGRRGVASLSVGSV